MSIKLTRIKKKYSNNIKHRIITRKKTIITNEEKNIEKTRHHVYFFYNSEKNSIRVIQEYISVRSCDVLSQHQKCQVTGHAKVKV